MLQNMEKLVRLALDCGVTGPAMRMKLMDGLPRGFVYSLPTVSRPIDQLRFDLMELERTPRLIGLDRPPLAVWLENAAMICATEGFTEQAQVFAETADQVHPEGRVMQRLSLKPLYEGVAPKSTLMPRHRRLRVLQIHPDARWAWSNFDSPLDPQGRVHSVQTLKGAWYLNHTPNSAIWREAVENIDAALKEIEQADDCYDYLGVFARLPEALGALLGSRLTRRSSVTVCDPETGWQPWGPAWSSPIMPSRDPELQVEGLPRFTPDELAVVVEVGGSLDPIRIDTALEAAWAPYPPRVRITSNNREIPSPETIERMVFDLNDFTATLCAQHGGLKKLHLFYQGPLPLMVRWAQTLHDCPFQVVVYTEQSDGGMLPAVTLGGGRAADLVEEGPMEPAHSNNDAFILHNSLYAERLCQALVEEGLRVACGMNAPANVGSIIVLITSFTDYADLAHRVVNRREGRIIPVLIEGAHPRNLPGFMRCTDPFDANGKDAYMVGPQLARIVSPD